MSPPCPSQITGLVLAGGRGARMGGVDKGWVIFEGEPLIHTVLRRFAPQVRSVLISANRSIAAYRALGEVVTDADGDPALEPFPGPLAGLLAGLQRARTDWIALVPCDAPAVPHDLVARLAAQAGDGDIACPRALGRRQPVFALLRRSTSASLRAYLESGGRGMQRWYETLRLVDVDFDDADGFRNINDPASG